MIKIYRYDSMSKEFQDVVNNLTLKGKKRDNALNDAIKRLGTEVSIQEYFKDYDRDSFYDRKWSYKCFGEPENVIERLAYSELEWDNGLSYCNVANHSPEDLCEERTSWEEMKSYANGLCNFIDSLKSAIAAGEVGIIKTQDNEE